MENLRIRLFWVNQDQKDLFLSDLAALADNPLAGQITLLNPTMGIPLPDGICYPEGTIPSGFLSELVGGIHHLENGPDEVVIVSKKGGQDD